MSKIHLFSAALFLLAVSPLSAFVPDEFDGATTGSQWQFVNSDPPSTGSVINGHYEVHGSIGSDHYFWIDNHAFIQQDAPTGTNWEVTTKLDDFNPTAEGQRRRFTRAGMQLWQDNDHFITLSLISSEFGDALNSHNFWQFDANPSPENDWRLMDGIDLFGYPPLPNASLWMKIRSSPRGYQGFMSTDGVNWLECLTIVKNADSPDGMMTNPKIRLFHAGGFQHTGPAEAPVPADQAITPAKFDFIRSEAYLEPDLPYADDEFNGTELGPQWRYYAGIGEGSYGFFNGHLNLTGGVFSDMWSEIEQNSHVYQNEPDFPNYQVTTKVAPVDMTQIPYELWNSYGIWLWKNQSNWIFISNSRGDQQVGGIWTPNNRIEAAVKYNGGMFHDRNQSFYPGDAPAYLRVVKEGTVAEVQYSFDNVTYVPWHFVVGGVNQTKFDLGAGDLQVRLFTKRVSGDGTDVDGNDNPPMDAQFDWIHAEALASDVADWNLY